MFSDDDGMEKVVPSFAKAEVSNCRAKRIRIEPRSGDILPAPGFRGCCSAPEARKNVAQRVSAGFTFRIDEQSPGGAKDRSRLFLRPSGANSVFRTENPALTRWATFFRAYGASWPVHEIGSPG